MFLSDCLFVARLSVSPSVRLSACVAREGVGGGSGGRWEETGIGDGGGGRERWDTGAGTRTC